MKYKTIITLAVLMLASLAVRCQDVENIKDTVYLQFKAGDFRLTAATKKKLNRVALLLRADTALGLKLCGAAPDLCPKCEERLFLRLTTVADYLLTKGVRADHIGTLMWLDRETNQVALVTGNRVRVDPVPAPHPNLHARQ